MNDRPPVTRRLLLGRFAAGAPVLGTFLLPALPHEAMARMRHGAHRRSPPHKPLPLIMLDPGHGGKDPGAIGVSGTYEKHISLATAFELKRQLEASGHYRVELTRARDVFVPLEARVEAAQVHHASLFVSMHADALLDHTVRGASVYTLAPTASDTETAALARRENNAGMSGRRRLDHLPASVTAVTTHLQREQTRADSRRLAHGMLDSLDDDLRMLHHPERHAGFVVLKAADIPSVLVEMGFMSNARDEALLRRADHRRLVAKAMRRAVDAYFAGALSLKAAETSEAGRMLPRSD